MRRYGLLAIIITTVVIRNFISDGILRLHLSGATQAASSRAYYAHTALSVY